MSSTIKILAFAGSNRTGALNKTLSKAAAAAFGPAASVTWIDLKDFPIPLYDGDLETEYGQPAAALALRALFRQHDALLIASPEYNGFFSPLLKNTFDWLSRPLEGEERHAAFKDKQVLLLSATRGSNAGTRGLQSLRQLLANLKAHSYETEYLLPKATEAFDEQGNFINELNQIRLKQLAGNFVSHVRELRRQAA